MLFALVALALGHQAKPDNPIEFKNLHVYPRKIEESLYRHSKVQAVGGGPANGEAVCCFNVPKPGQSASAEGDPRDLCRPIAHFKIPRHIRFVADFPITATGKPQKFVMRERMLRELKVAEEKTA